MMADRYDLHSSTVPTSEAAVDGLFSGFVAGLAMVVFLVVAELLNGDALSVILGRFSIDGATSPLVGLLSHLATSVVYGTLFGVLWCVSLRRLRQRIPSWLGGAVYGLALWLLAAFVILPPSESVLREFSVCQFASAHLI